MTAISRRWCRTARCGLCESGAPLFIEDLGKSNRFLRADSATKVGINRGFAIPCPVRDGQTWVMAFLSALGTPIARRVEVWTPDVARAGRGEPAALTRTSGFCEQAGNLGSAASVIERGQGSIGQVVLTGVPVVSVDAVAEPAGVGADAQAAGLQSLIALPLIRDGKLLSVVVWYF